MKKKLTYEEAIENLENIVKELEDGNVPLDKALELFEEGARLTSFCSKALETAEQKILSVTEAEAKKEGDCDA